MHMHSATSKLYAWQYDSYTYVVECKQTLQKPNNGSDWIFTWVYIAYKQALQEPIN